MSKSQQRDFIHNPVMKALIIYDNFKFATRANAALQRAAYRADTIVQWTVIPWQLEVLRLLPAADAALKEAIDAHLIIVAGTSRAGVSFLASTLVGALGSAAANSRCRSRRG